MKALRSQQHAGPADEVRRLWDRRLWGRRAALGRAAFDGLLARLAPGARWLFARLLELVAAVCFDGGHELHAQKLLKLVVSGDPNALPDSQCAKQVGDELLEEMLIN